jgi:hypothetical protein
MVTPKSTQDVAAQVAGQRAALEAQRAVRQLNVEPQRPSEYGCPQTTVFNLSQLSCFSPAELLSARCSASCYPQLSECLYFYSTRQR